MAAGEERRRQALILSRIRRLQRRLNTEVWLREAVVPLWCAATAAALHRLLLGSHTIWIVPLLFVGAGGWWWSRVLSRRLGESDAAILLDRGAGAGGLLLTRLELPVGAWELGLNESVRRASPPDVNRARPAALSAGAVLFLAVAMLVPLPERAVTSVNAAASSRVAQLEAHAEALAREDPLEESVEAELARLREELAAGEFDATDWEAADHLERALARNAAEAQAELGRAAAAAEALEQAVEMAQGGDAAARERDALERALMAMDENASSGAEALEKALAQAGQNGAESGGTGEKGGLGEPGGRPSKSELSQLREALRDRQERMAKAFGQGTGDQRRASNQGSPRQSQGQGQGEGEGEDEGKGQGQGEGAAQGKGQATGERGGPSRGGGEGELRFDQPVEMDPDRLAFAPLPEGQGGDPGALWGLKAADPKPSNEPSSGGASAGSVARGEQAPAFDQSARLPRNRELVRRYFDSEQ